MIRLTITKDYLKEVLRGKIKRSYAYKYSIDEKVNNVLDEVLRGCKRYIPYSQNEYKSPHLYTTIEQNLMSDKATKEKYKILRIIDTSWLMKDNNKYLKDLSKIMRIK